MEKEQRICFKKRMFIVGGVKFIALFSLMGRILFLQTKKKREFENLSCTNRFSMLYIQGIRGPIVDVKNQIIATNCTTYDLYLNIEDKETLYSDVEKIDNLIKGLKNIKIETNSQYILLQKNISYEKMAILQNKFHEIPRIFFEASQERFYPYPNFLGHVIGYTGNASKKDIEKNNELSKFCLSTIGKCGLEKQYDNELMGEKGWKKIELNAKRSITKIVETKMPSSGKVLKTTLSFDLQKRIYEILEPHKSATAIVMNPHTGAILGSLSYPGYDTNVFNKRISKKYWNELVNDPTKPLLNKITQGIYSPGSLFKMVVMLAALEYEVISQDFSVFCNGHYDLGNNRFHCWAWRKGGHGTMSLKNSITQSCDVMFYHLANKLPVEKLQEIAKDFGFGRLTGIDIPNEKTGLFPTPEWKNKRYGKKWSKGDSCNLFIGQGAFISTPIQIAHMVSMFANGGKVITPHYIRPTHIWKQKRIYNEKNLKMITDAMEDTIISGTGRKARTFDPDFEIAGKTGTTQSARIELWQRKDKNFMDSLPYHLRDNAFFCGYAPVENPRYSVIVIIEHGGWGCTSASIGRDILLAAREILG